MVLRKILPYLILVLFWALAVGDVEAQCAMCKATAESATDNIDQSIGEGLNRGIIYLMAAPYALLILIGAVFFRKKIMRFYRELAGSY